MLNNKNIIVTGANRGIGKEILLHAAINSGNIISCARTKSDEHEDYLNSLSKEYQINTYSYYFDLADYESVKRVSKEIIAEVDKIDGIVNNAGIASGDLFAMTKIERMKELFEVNFFAQLNFLHQFIRNMMKHKSGSIINVGSTAGIIGDRGTTAYGASKAALMYASKSIASEVGAFNIRVNNIAPGITKTDMYDQMDEKAVESALAKVPLKRLAEPSEVASTVIFLLSDFSSYVNGQTIRVDGGSL